MSASRVGGKCRSSVARPTPALRATSRIDTSMPCSATAGRATVSRWSRFLWRRRASHPPSLPNGSLIHIFGSANHLTGSLIRISVTVLRSEDDDDAHHNEGNPAAHVRRPPRTAIRGGSGPRTAPDEVLVRVKAAGLNPPDWYVREGMPGVPRRVQAALRPAADPGHGRLGNRGSRRRRRPGIRARGGRGDGPAALPPR